MNTLITSNGQFVPALVAFVRHVGLDVPFNISPEDMNKLLQANWFAKDAAFRHKIQEQGKRLPNAEERELIKDLGCLDEMPVSLTGQDLSYGMILLGSTVPAVRKRLAYGVNQYWKSRAVHKRKKVFLLGSKRPLNPKIESEEVLLAPGILPLRAGWQRPDRLPATEIEMMSYEWDRSQLPPGWQKVLVPSADRPKGDGTFRPANTGETAEDWLRQTGIIVGTFYVMSSQPYVGYQVANLERVAYGNVGFIGIGPAANLDTKIEVYLDNFAKWLYELILLREKMELEKQVAGKSTQ